MDTRDILLAIDAEIAKLQQVKANIERRFYSEAQTRSRGQGVVHGI
jgi:hypothetical protein